MDSRQRVINYYNKTHFGYKLVWGLYNNLSMHYGFYDADHRSHNEAVINLNRVLSRMAKITKKDKILDVCCGFGGSSIWLAKTFGAKVTGIDINKKHIAIARSLARENHVDHLVDFFVMDANKTDLINESFSVVWVIEPMVHIKNKEILVSEMRRLLKKEGRLVAADFFLTRDKYSKDERKLLDRWMTGWCGQNMSRVKEFKGYLKNEKFSGIKFFDVTSSIMPSSRRMYFICHFTFPAGKIFQLFGLKSNIQTNSSFSGICQYKALKKGLWTYGIFYGEKN